MLCRIYSIEHVSFKLLKSNPPQLVVTVIGLTSSSGWTDPELASWMYIMPPADGILDLDFLAKSPTGPSLPFLAPISASLSIIAPSWFRGVRVHSSTNSVEVRSEANDGAHALASSGDPVPWPWSAEAADLRDEGPYVGEHTAFLAPPPNKSWEAWENQQPPGPARLIVTGRVETMNGAIVPILVPRNPDGHLFTLELLVVNMGGIGTTDVAYREARFDTVVPKGRFKEVRIIWQGSLLTALPVTIVA